MIFFYLLIAILPLSDHHLLGASYGGFTFFKALGIVSLVAAIIHAFSKKEPTEIWNSWQARLSLVFLLGTLLSFFALTIGTTNDYSIVWSCASFLAFLITAVCLVDSVQALRRTFLWTIGSVAVASIYIIKEWWEVHNTFGPGFRPGGATGDANYYAMSALMGLVIAYFFLVSKRPAGERLFAFVCLCITLAGLSLAASRGGYLGMVTSFLYIVYRSRRPVRTLIVASVLIIPFAVLLPSSPLDRFLHPSYGDQVGTESRQLVWKAGWRMIRENPFFGIGAGRFKPEVERYEEADEHIRGLAHNTYIEIASEMGIPALLLFISILGATYASLERVRRLSLRNGPDLIHWSATAIQASLLGYAVCLVFLSGQYQKHLWFMVFLSIPLECVARRYALRARLQVSSSAYGRSRSRLVKSGVLAAQVQS